MNFSSQRNLLDKFNLNIDQLDYKYIENCKDVKKLERILKVLRSGEEGIFPHLISFCAQKLSEKDPENALLMKENRIKRYADIPATERMQIQQEIKDWSNPASYETKKCDEQFMKDENDLPPIRAQWKLGEEETKHRMCIEQKTKISKPRDYKDWDRFNVDEELQKLDNVTSQEKTKTSLNTKTELCDKICANGLTLPECVHISNLENIKGNEAFKAKEYEEAVAYYSRSLSVYKTTKALNNRAQAYIKLKNYTAAVKDCIEVLNMEPNNIKAIYRRGLAHKEAGLHDIAAIDFYLVLELDPECQAAKNQLHQIENIKKVDSISLLNKETESKVLIEELQPSDNEADQTLDEIKSLHEDETATQITIEEVNEQSENTKHILLDDLCHFSEEQYGDRSLPQKVKNMFLITQLKKEPKTLGRQTKSSSNLLQIENHDTDKTPRDKTKKILNSIDETTDKIKSSVPKILESGIQDTRKGHCEVITVSGKSDNALKNLENSRNRKVTSTNKNKTDKSNVTHKEGNVDQSKNNCVEYFNVPMQESKELIPGTKVTPFEFINMWSRKNAYKDSEAGSAILLKIKPEELPKTITCKLDDKLLISLLKAIGKLIDKGNYHLSVKYLNNLIKTPRIGTIAMLLTKKEKNDIHNLFSILEEKENGITLQARNILNIKH